MDKVTLVEGDLEVAGKLVSLLVDRGLPVQMAAWVRRELDAPFKLLIASPNIQKFGPLVAYELLVETLQSSNLTLGLDNIRITNTTDMPSGPDQSFSYVFPVSGLQDEVFVFRSQDRVRASAIPPVASAAA